MHTDPSDEGRRALIRLLDDLPGMVAYWDASLRCRFANRAYETWFGVTAQAMLGREMREFLGPLFELNKPYIEGVLRGEPQQFEREIPDPHGGAARYSQAHYIPDVVDGVVRGFTVLVADLTQRRHAEQALHKMERQVQASERLAAVATLAAGTAHELNNPLAAVLGNIELALEELDRDADRALLRSALTEARGALDRARTILRNMALLAQGETATREPVDIDTVIDTSIELTSSAFRYKAHVVRDQSGHGRVLANANQLVQVLVNLLLNASQALPDDAIDRNEIRVVSRRELGRVIVEVRDNGPGIPAELHARIFEPFFTTRAVGGGMGLGLSIALGIVRAHGGTLAAVHGEGATGAVFVVSLPETAEIARPPSAPTAARAEPAPSVPRKRILLVDDEKLITRTLERALDRSYDVVIANSGQAALAVLAERAYPIDLVLCDLMMPEMTGGEVYDTVIARHRELRDRFVIMTGGAFTWRGEEFLSAFRGPVLRKPFDLAEVRRILAGLLT